MSSGDSGFTLKGLRVGLFVLGCSWNVLFIPLLGFFGEERGLRFSNKDQPAVKVTRLRT